MYTKYLIICIIIVVILYFLYKIKFKGSGYFSEHFSIEKVHSKWRPGKYNYDENYAISDRLDKEETFNKPANNLKLKSMDFNLKLSSITDTLRNSISYKDGMNIINGFRNNGIPGYTEHIDRSKVIEKYKSSHSPAYYDIVAHYKFINDLNISKSFAPHWKFHSVYNRARIDGKADNLLNNYILSLPTDNEIKSKVLKMFNNDEIVDIKQYWSLYSYDDQTSIDYNTCTLLNTKLFKNEKNIDDNFLNRRCIERWVHDQNGGFVPILAAEMSANHIELSFAFRNNKLEVCLKYPRFIKIGAPFIFVSARDSQYEPVVLEKKTYNDKIIKVMDKFIDKTTPEFNQELNEALKGTDVQANVNNLVSEYIDTLHKISGKFTLNNFKAYNKFYPFLLEFTIDPSIKSYEKKALMYSYEITQERLHNNCKRRIDFIHKQD